MDDFDELRANLLSEDEVALMASKMSVGATMFSIKEGGPYEDGVGIIISTQYSDGLALAIHFCTKSRLLNIRDTIDELLFGNVDA